LAAELEARYPDASITMQPSRGGRFEVSLDGRPIFEKSKLGRHAKEGEVLGLIERARAERAG
jgi:selT/selW/selH-like putative selenoprotein